MQSTGEGTGNPLQYSCLENLMSNMKKQEDRTLKDELSRSVGAQYATGDQWRNNSRKNEEMLPEQAQHPVVDVTGGGSKVLERHPMASSRHGRQDIVAVFAQNLIHFK